MLCIDDPQHAEADVGIADVGGGGAAAFQRALLAAVAPGQSAEGAAAGRAPGEPFADVAVHVVGADGTGLVTPDRCGFRRAVVALQAVVVERALAADVVHVAARAGTAVAASGRGAQPFRVVRQSVFLAGAVRQPGGVRGGVVPAYAYHRMVRALRETRVAPFPAVHGGK